jgi:AraC-like DNA-binding protein
MIFTTAIKSITGKFFSSYENNPDFQMLLLRLSKKGMLFSGVIGIIATTAYIIVNILFDRRTVAWNYVAPYPDLMVLWDKLLIILLSVVAIILSRLKLTLSLYRILFTFIIFICAVAILSDDIFNQDLNFSSAYLTILLLLASVCIPFKPWQILAICILMMLLLFPGLLYLQELFGLTGLHVPGSQIVYLIIVTVILVGTTTMLYHSRYAQYILRKSADGLLEASYFTGNAEKNQKEMDQARNLIKQNSFDGIQQLVKDIDVPSMDQVFLEKVKAVIETHIGDANFGVEWLAHEVALSPRQLQRKLRTAIGLSAGNLIRVMRMQRAAQLLEKKAGNVSEIAYKVGFHDPVYFSRIFRQMYDMSPSEYTKNRKRDIFKLQ